MAELMNQLNPRESHFGKLDFQGPNFLGTQTHHKKKKAFQEGGTGEKAKMWDKNFSN